MIGIGFHLNDLFRALTFVAVLVIKVKKSENQSEETKKTFKIVGGMLFFFLCIFALIKILNWIGDYNVLGKPMKSS